LDWLRFDLNIALTQQLNVKVEKETTGLFQTNEGVRRTVDKSPDAVLVV